MTNLARRRVGRPRWERELRAKIAPVSTPAERDEFIAMCRSIRESPDWPEYRRELGDMARACIDDLAEDGATPELGELLAEALAEWPPDRGRIAYLRRALARSCRDDPNGP